MQDYYTSLMSRVNACASALHTLNNDIARVMRDARATRDLCDYLISL